MARRSPRWREVPPAPTDGEEWRRVDGYPGYYVSTLGRVWGRCGRLITGSRLLGGYRSIQLHRGDGSITSRLAHCLVAEAFIGPRPPDQEVNHRDGNTANNHVDNLEYVTHAENVIHSYRILGARGPRGSNSGHAKLNERQVVEIRARYAAGGVSTIRLGREYGISQTVISGIVNRRKWRHAEEDLAADTQCTEGIRGGARGATP